MESETIDTKPEVLLDKENKDHQTHVTKIPFKVKSITGEELLNMKVEMNISLSSDPPFR